MSYTVLTLSQHWPNPPKTWFTLPKLNEYPSFCVKYVNSWLNTNEPFNANLKKNAAAQIDIIRCILASPYESVSIRWVVHLSVRPIPCIFFEHGKRAKMNKKLNKS